MGRIFVVLIADTIAGNIMFGLLLLLKDKLINYSSNLYCILLKTTLLYFILSSLGTILSFLCDYASSEKIFVYRPDFDYYTLTATQFIFSSSLYRYLLMGWLFGVIFNLLKNRLMEKRFSKAIMRACEPINIEHVLSLKNKLVRELKIKREIPLYYCSLKMSSMTIGILRPVIILTGKDKLEDYEFILKHELTHIRSYDILYQKLLLYFRALQWFNPFCRRFIKTFFEYIELACDEKALHSETIDGRLRYAQLILKVAKENRRECHAFSAEFAQANHTQLKRRIENIMRINVKKVSRSLIAVIAVLVIVVCPATIYASTMGISSVEKTLTTINQENKESVELLQTLDECEQEISLRMLESIPKITIRGTNPIDEYLAKGKSLRADVTIPRDVNTLVVDFSSNNSSDKFKIAVVDSSGRGTSVSTSNGKLTHSFSVTSGASYSVVITNTSTAEIHIVGRIYI